jgi:hypothetical protein
MKSNKRLLFFLSVYLLICAAALVTFIEPALNGNNDFRVWADSVHYMELAKDKMLGGVDNNISIFSVPSILFFLGNDVAAFFILNVLLVSIGYFSLCRCFDFKKEEFLYWILVNPMFFFSLLTPSKEILAFSSIMMLNCFIKSRRYPYLIFAALFSLFARVQLFFVLVLFIFLTSKFYFFNKRRLVTLIAFLLIMSGLYPFISQYLLGEDINFALDLYFTRNTGSGVANILYELQNKGLYFVVFIPKLFLNFFGNIPKIQDCFVVPLDENGKIDVYASWANTGHQILWTVMLVIAVAKKKFKFDLANDFTYYVCLNIIFFIITPFIQPRYIFPVYATFALQFTLKNTRKISKTLKNTLVVQRTYWY